MSFALEWFIGLDLRDLGILGLGIDLEDNGFEGLEWFGYNGFEDFGAEFLFLLFAREKHVKLIKMIKHSVTCQRNWPCNWYV